MTFFASCYIKLHRTGEEEAYPTCLHMYISTISGQVEIYPIPGNNAEIIPRFSAPFEGVDLRRDYQ